MSCNRLSHVSRVKPVLIPLLSNLTEADKAMQYPEMPTDESK